MVNPILMQPRNSLQYADKMNLVADELVDNIKFLVEQNNGQMPKTFTNELHKWSLESIGVVTLDKHLGSDSWADTDTQYRLSADTAGLQIRADTKKLSDTFI
jgi:hypothetical protein